MNYHGLLILCCFFVFIQVSQGASCENVTDCRACVLTGASCVWCVKDGSESCMEGTFTGSALGKDYCDDFYWAQCAVRGRIFKVAESYLIIAAIVVFLIIVIIFVGVLCCCHFCECCHGKEEDEKEKKEKRKNDYEMAESYSKGSKLTKSPSSASESEYEQRRKEMFHSASNYSKEPDPIPLSTSSSERKDSIPSYPLYRPPTDEPPMQPNFSSSGTIEDRPPTPPPTFAQSVQYSSSNYSSMPPPQYDPSSRRGSSKHHLGDSVDHQQVSINVDSHMDDEMGRPPTPPNEDSPPRYNPPQYRPPSQFLEQQPNYGTDSTNGITMADFDSGGGDFGDIEKTLASLQMDLDKNF